MVLLCYSCRNHHRSTPDSSPSRQDAHASLIVVPTQLCALRHLKLFNRIALPAISLENDTKLRDEFTDWIMVKGSLHLRLLTPAWNRSSSKEDLLATTTDRRDSSQVDVGLRNGWANVTNSRCRSTDSSA